MTYKQAYGLINPEVRTLEEVIYWVNNYKDLYESDLIGLINSNTATRGYYTDKIHKNHLGYTVFKLEKMRRDYCE